MAATAEAYYGRLLTGAGEHTGTRPTSHGREITSGWRMGWGEAVSGVTCVGGWWGCRGVCVCVCGVGRRRWRVSPGEAGLGTLVYNNFVSGSGGAQTRSPCSLLIALVMLSGIFILFLVPCF